AWPGWLSNWFAPKAVMPSSRRTALRRASIPVTSKTVYMPHRTSAAGGLCRERHLGAQAALLEERERAPELVANERAHDREPGAVAVAVQPLAVVSDGEDDVVPALRELDRDRAPAVLERVAEQLREDERERRRAVARERHRLQHCVHRLRPAEALDERRAQ